MRLCIWSMPGGLCASMYMVHAWCFMCVYVCASMRGGLCASMPMSLLACDQVAKLCLSWHLTSLSTSIQSMGSVYSMYRLFTSAVDIIDNIEVSSDSEVSSEHLVEQDVYDEDNFYYGSALCVANGKGQGLCA